MAGLRETLETKGKKKISVHVNEIRTNKLNQYPMDDIEELALQFLEMEEQIQPGEAYEDELQDGKRFTLTSGERRYRAIKLLYSRGEHDGMMDLIIVNKPQDIWEERRRIRAANVYRTHSQETRWMEIKECEEEYQHLIEIEQKPKGLKRDWIAAQLGISGRTVDRYLKDPKAPNSETAEQKKEDEKRKKQIEAGKSVGKAIIVDVARRKTLYNAKDEINKKFREIFAVDFDLLEIDGKYYVLAKGLIIEYE